MPTITDWLMVGITLAYSITTIAIWFANRKSASATENQLIESRRQFVENQRMQMMPSLQIDVDEISNGSDCKAELEYTLFSDERLEHCHSTYFFLTLENAGLGAAKNMAFWWTNAEGEVSTDKLPVAVLYQQDIVKYIITVGITKKNAQVGKQIEAQLSVIYKDLLDNEYTQSIRLFFEVSSDQYAVLKNHVIGKATFSE